MPAAAGLRGPTRGRKRAHPKARFGAAIRPAPRRRPQEVEEIERRVGARADRRRPARRLPARPPSASRSPQPARAPQFTHHRRDRAALVLVKQRLEHRIGPGCATGSGANAIMSGWRRGACRHDRRGRARRRCHGLLVRRRRPRRRVAAGRGECVGDARRRRDIALPPSRPAPPVSRRDVAEEGERQVASFCTVAAAVSVTASPAAPPWCPRPALRPRTGCCRSRRASPPARHRPA